jgi:hypothetical protein
VGWQTFFRFFFTTRMVAVVAWALSKALLIRLQALTVGEKAENKRLIL